MDPLVGERIVVEVLDSHGRPRSSTPLTLAADAAQFTLGRAVTADVVVDDPYVAAHHVRIELAPDGRLLASDLATVNGFHVKSQRHRGVQDLPLPDGELQIGRTRLRIRTRHETLAAEKSDYGVSASSMPNAGWVALWGALAWALAVGYNAWLDAPRDTPTQVTTALIAAFAGAGVWVAIWALLTRIILGEWRWTIHAAILFAVSAVAFVASLWLDVGWFSLALPPLPVRDGGLGVLALSVLLFLHVRNVTATRRRTASIVAAVLPLLVAGTIAWVQERGQARNPNFINAPDPLYPPALRLRAAESVDDYFAAAARLRAAADARRKATPSDDDAEESDDD